MQPDEIAQLRKEYTRHILDESNVYPSPFSQFEHWWNEARQAKVEEPNAMTLATAASDGMVDARTVLLKNFDERGFVFFTNYNSHKSLQLAKNPQCCLLFYWKEMERQVKIIGRAERISREETVAYFQTRPHGSKIGAWASPQSWVVASKAWLQQTFDYYRERFKHGEIPPPPHWGGFCVIPQRMEFWQGRPHRMHDRIEYYLNHRQEWMIRRLAP